MSIKMAVPAGFEFSFKCPMKETAGFLCTRHGCYVMLMCLQSNTVPSVLVNYLHTLIPVSALQFLLMFSFNCYLKVNYVQLKADHYNC